MTEPGQIRTVTTPVRLQMCYLDSNSAKIGEFSFGSSLQDGALTVRSLPEQYPVPIQFISLRLA